MRFDIITIFPKIFGSYLSESILRRAQEKRLVTICAHDLRKFSRDKHKKVDDKPYGGGAGMVIQAESILRAVESILKKSKNHPIIRQGALSDDRAKIKTKIILLSAKGEQFTQKMAYDWAKKYDRLVLISGRYEGIDERVSVALRDMTKIKNVVYNSDRAYRRQFSVSPISFAEVSVGPYVLTDGDAAAMVIISAVTRLIPGVISSESLQEESFPSKALKTESRKREAAQAEYPHYTRPEVFIWQGKTYRAPKILLSGDHKKIQIYRERKRKKAH